MYRFLCLILLTACTLAAAKHRVLFNRYRVPETGLFIADVNGANERAVTPHHESEYSPSLSADGQWVVFTSETAGQSDIWRVHPDGSGLQQITDDPAFDDQGALSPDGKTLAFVSTRAGGFANIWVLALATRKYRNLTPASSGNFRPRWSPDAGSRSWFTPDRDADAGVNPDHWELMQSTGIYIIHPDGTGLRRLTRAGGFAGSPEWSADGSELIYYETDEMGAYMAKGARSRTEIASIDVATGKRRLLTASNETKLSPQWLSGGRISYVVRTGDDKEGLRIKNADQTVATVAKGLVRHAAWLPDEKRVIYERVLPIRPRPST